MLFPLYRSDSESTSVNSAPRVRSKLVTATLCVVICMGSGTGLAGKIYKWTDAEGNVHYGSEKPADTAAEKMKVDTSKTGVDRGAKALADIKQKEDDEETIVTTNESSDVVDEVGQAALRCGQTGPRHDPVPRSAQGTRR